MGIFSDEVQKTSVTQYIEILSNKDEIDWWQFQQLVESMSMQENGCKEAVEAIRKRLKHGDTHRKLRVLEVLKLLTENSNPHFRRQMINNEKMKERFDLLLSSPGEDARVKKELHGLLSAWSREYREERDIDKLSTIYKSGTTTRSRSGSAAPVTPVVTNRSTDASSNSRSQPTSPTTTTKQAPPPKPVKPARQRSQSAATASNTISHPPKPLEIQSEVTSAVKNLNFLLNALKLINTSEDRWEIDLQHDASVQQLRENCKESKKKIERYTRLVEDEEWIGTLVATNDDLLKALEMYDMMLAGQVPDTLPTSPTQDHQYHYRNAPSIPHVQSSTEPSLSTNDAVYQKLGTMQLSDKPYEEEEDPFADPVENDGNRKGELIL